MRSGCSKQLVRAEQHSLSVNDFFELYKGQIEEELDPLADDPEEWGPPCKRLAAEMRQALARAKEIYAASERAEEAFAAMKSDSDEHVQRIGEALSSGYYDGVAI